MVEERSGGKSRDELAVEDYHKANGRFVTINLYQSAFDPQNSLDFKYLITIWIRNGTLDTFALIDDILHLLGKVVDRNVLVEN